MRGDRDDRRVPVPTRTVCRAAGRLRLACREIARFGVVGICGVFVSLAVFNLLRGTTELPTGRANAVATVVSIAFNYAGYRCFAYRHADRTHRARQVWLFVLFSAIGAVIENGVLYAATYGMHWSSPLAANFWKLAGIGMGFLFRFWSYRTWVFSPPRTVPVERREAAPKRPVVR